VSWWPRRRRDSLDRDLDRELRDHLERRVAELVREGRSVADASRQARLEFGGFELAKEECRDVRGRRWLSDVLQDARFGVRWIVKHLGLSAAVILTVGLAIGANGAIFAIGHATLLRGLPGDHGNRIVYVSTQTPQGDRGVSFADLEDWRQRVRAFASVAAFADASMTLREPALAPERVSGTYVSSTAFGLLGERPIVGRDFNEADDQPGAASVVMLGYRIWRDRYGSDPTVVGRAIEVNGTPSVVIGVMRDGFGFPQISEVWQPLAQRPGLEKETRGDRRLAAMARLATGMSMAMATVELDAVVQQLAMQHPATNTDVRGKLNTFAQAQNGGFSDAIAGMMAAVGAVLLIACANVAGLLLARSLQRTHEIATRAALGATRSRLVRQLLVESLLLAVAAGPIGLIVGLAGVFAFDQATANLIRPYWLDFSLDAQVVTFFAAVTIATGFVFGLLPAVVVSNASPIARMKLGDRRTGAARGVTRWSFGLVTFQLALTLALLGGAGVMMKGVRLLLRSDDAVPVSELMTLRFSLPAAKYQTPAQRLAFTRELESRLRAVPGVTSAAISSALPFTPAGVARASVSVPAVVGDGTKGDASLVLVSPSYFETMGMPLVRGVTFENTEAARDQAVVNLAFVSTFLSGQDPIGRRIRTAGRGSDTSSSPLTIVGVAPTIRYGRITEAEPVVYRVENGAAGPFSVLIVRSRADVSAVARSVRAAAKELDQDLPLFGLLTMERVRAQMRWQYPIFGTFLATFALLALLLASIGLYAVLSAAVSVRLHEIGVRRALGAKRGQVWWMVIRRALPAVLAGLALGMGAALVATPVLRSLLVQTSPTDGPTLANVSLLLLVVAFVACALPAWRATRVDPIVILRHD
jgi:predicted permease